MITSAQNSRIQWVRALLARRQDREKDGVFVIEGVRLVEEALNSSLHPRLVLFSSQLSTRGRRLVAAFAEMGVDVEEITPHLMDSLADTGTPQGVLAVLPFPQARPPSGLNFVVIADTLRDPGNLGTLLRTAAAAGAQAVFLAPGTVDAFSPKVLRAGMGAQLRMPVLTMDWPQIRQALKDQQNPPLQVLLAEASQGLPPWQIDLRRPTALVIGGEAEGACEQARALADHLVAIPMPGKSESLNAAVAAGILIFEVVRQRLT